MAKIKSTHVYIYKTWVDIKYKERDDEEELKEHQV